MASEPVYTVSFLGTTKSYYINVSAEAAETGRQFLAMVEDFKPEGLTLGNFLFLRRARSSRPVGFSADLRGDVDIISSLLTLGG